MGSPPVLRELLPLAAPREAGPAAELGTLSRSVRSRLRRRGHIGHLISDVVDTLNSLYGPARAKSTSPPSASQSASLEHIRSVIERAGPPTCSAAAAFTVLRGSRPGYVQEPEERAIYQEGNVALPAPGPRCQPAEWLTGEARKMWVDWRQRLMRIEDLGESPSIRPFSDFALIRDPLVCATVAGQLVDAGEAAAGPEGPRAVGIFFARKAPGQLRPIIDAWLVNPRFVDPCRGLLFIPGSWQSLRAPEGGHLRVAQLDVDSAFYCIDHPP